MKRCCEWTSIQLFKLQHLQLLYSVLASALEFGFFLWRSFIPRGISSRSLSSYLKQILASSMSRERFCSSSWVSIVYFISRVWSIPFPIVKLTLTKLDSSKPRSSFMIEVLLMLLIIVYHERELHLLSAPRSSHVPMSSAARQNFCPFRWMIRNRRYVRTKIIVNALYLRSISKWYHLLSACTLHIVVTALTKRRVDSVDRHANKPVKVQWVLFQDEHHWLLLSAWVPSFALSRPICSKILSPLLEDTYLYSQ